MNEIEGEDMFASNNSNCQVLDTIDQEVLLEKLKLYGIRALTFHPIQNYLQNRNQYVCLSSM